MASSKDSPPVGRFWPKPRKSIANLMPHENLPAGVAGNPFPYLDAESDSSYLFSKENFFWSGHPLFRKLRPKTEITVVMGRKGTGKTAFARAYGKFLIDKYTLSCYFQQPLHFSETQTLFAEVALDFVSDNPLYLPNSMAERKLLATWFKASIDNSIIAAKISRAIFQFTHAEWFRDTGTKSQRQELKKSAERELGEFGKLIETAEYHAYNKFQALSVLHQCMQSLDFRKVRAVFDLGKNLSEVEVSNMHDFIELNMSRAEIVLFAQPDSNWVNLAGNGATFEELTWSTGTRNLLEQMARYRWGIVSNSELESLFIKGALRYLLKCADGNPGRFVELWNKILDLKKPRQKISTQLIDKANL